jgi:hypothetical protein
MAASGSSNEGARIGRPLRFHGGMSELDAPIRRTFTGGGYNGGGSMTFTLSGDRIGTTVIRG